jgi:iron complex outermembrane receptor protein
LLARTLHSALEPEPFWDEARFARLAPMGDHVRGGLSRWLCAALAGGAASALCHSGAWAQSVADLQSMSLGQLADIDVTSVSKRAESLSDADAAVYVITHDDIVRSGATSIPEILRLAPNLQVAVISANSYAITARGFNGNAADKLLVMIDGRSVYTPLFGGVIWDEQDVPPEDIERIEVISGPGATLWGANAVNGVINIITRKAADTPGGLLELAAGNRESRASVQYGGKLADDLAYRVYAETFSILNDKTSTGVDAGDGWAKAQGGFRLDWTPGADRVTLQGDLYHGTEQQLAAPSLDMAGGDIQATWQHQLAGGSSLQLLTYYDETRRFTDGIGGYSLQTYDLELQHSISLGDRQKIVWGVGGRVYQDRFENAGNVVFLPAASTQGLGDIFGQDSIALTKALQLTVGVKLEKDPYIDGAAVLPTARLSWKLADDALLWAAVSRAVRAPTLFDEDLQDSVVPSVLILQGNHDFRLEKLTAYELGARFRFARTASVSISAYYNVYDDLRSLEWLQMDRIPLLLQWGNMMQGETYGIEVWGDYRPRDWWTLAAGLDLQHQDLRFKPGASTANSIDEAGDDPDVQASLRSTVGLGHHVSWTLDARYVGALPNPQIPAYAELDTTVSWAVTPRLQLYVTGANLLHPQHLEYEEAGATVGDEVPRSVMVGTKLRF